MKLEVFTGVGIPGWSKVLKHTLVVVGEHSLQGARHRVGPEEVMVESIVSIQPGKDKSLLFSRIIRNSFHLLLGSKERSLSMRSQAY